MSRREPQTQHLLLISHHNSYRIASYIQAAKKRCMQVTIASESRHSLVSEIASGLQVNFSDSESAIRSILQAHEKTPFHGILGSDDATVELAARIAGQLQLPHNPPQAARCSQRKDLARAELMLAGCPVPIHCLVDINMPPEKQLAGLPWPCVLKPLNMSASRGVIRVDNEAAYLKAIERLRPIQATASGEFEQHHLLVEAYIDGIEIAYEGYLHRGRLHNITIFDKPDPLTGPYFEETIYVTPSSLDQALQKNIHNVVEKACHAYGLSTGAVHAECRIDAENNVWILEIASRTIGGDCARILDNENFSVEELAISLATGRPIDVSLPPQARGVMMIPVRQNGLLKRTEGLLAARQVSGIEKIDIAIPEGHELVPLPEGNQYLGYIFARGDTADEVTQALRQAHSELRFVTAPVIKIEGKPKESASI